MGIGAQGRLERLDRPEAITTCSHINVTPFPKVRASSGELPVTGCANRDAHRLDARNHPSALFSACCTCEHLAYGHRACVCPSTHLIILRSSWSLMESAELLECFGLPTHRLTNRSSNLDFPKVASPLTVAGHLWKLDLLYYRPQWRGCSSFKPPCWSTRPQITRPAVICYMRSPHSPQMRLLNLRFASSFLISSTPSSILSSSPPYHHKEEEDFSSATTSQLLLPQYRAALSIASPFTCPSWTAYPSTMWLASMRSAPS